MVAGTRLLASLKQTGFCSCVFERPNAGKGKVRERASAETFAEETIMEGYETAATEEEERAQLLALNRRAQAE